VIKLVKQDVKKGLNIAQIEKIKLNSDSYERVLESIQSRLSEGEKIFVVTPNPEFIVFARENPWFVSILNKADIAIPDGIGLVWASKILGTKPIIRQRISGTDLMNDLCGLAAQNKWRVFFLGGQIPGVAQKTLKILSQKYPGLKGKTDSGPVNLKLDEINKNNPEIQKLVAKINKTKADLLFVAFGMGKQEKFIFENWENLNIKLAIGIGGAFNYLSGESKRPPKWLQNLGFEWLYRLLSQPWRFKRQLNVFKFGFWVLKKKLFS